MAPSEVVSIVVWRNWKPGLYVRNDSLQTLNWIKKLITIEKKNTVFKEKMKRRKFFRGNTKFE